MSIGYSEVIGKRLLGKQVEIYTGDEHDTLLYNDSEIIRKSIIVGTLVEVDQECVIVECYKANLTNRIYINSWNIVAIVELTTKLGMHDMYLPAERKQIKQK